LRGVVRTFELTRPPLTGVNLLAHFQKTSKKKKKVKAQSGSST